MKRECWKNVAGFEGRYEVSNLGRIRSLDRFVPGVSTAGRICQRWRQGRVLKTYPINSGYLIVHLSAGFRGARQAHLVHRLVGEAFKGLKPSDQINHKDLVKSNNAATNIERSTPKANTQHALANGRGRWCL